MDTSMNPSEFDRDLAELSSAEDFLEFFAIDYDPAVVRVNRLHILQRFHDYLAAVDDMPEDDTGRRWLHAHLLREAYEDFVESDALREKVFRVFRMQERTSVRVPLPVLDRG